jgi:hypothetical protein
MNFIGNAEKKELAQWELKAKKSRLSLTEWVTRTLNRAVEMVDKRDEDEQLSNLELMEMKYVKLPFTYLELLSCKKLAKSEKLTLEKWMIKTIGDKIHPTMVGLKHYETGSSKRPTPKQWMESKYGKYDGSPEWNAGYENMMLNHRDELEVSFEDDAEFRKELVRICMKNAGVTMSTLEKQNGKVIEV